MSFNAICENKILAKISEFTVYDKFVISTMYQYTVMSSVMLT